MTGRTLAVLGLFALLSAIAAAWAVQQGWERWRVPEQGALVFPQLQHRVDDVARIEIESATAAMTIQRRDGSWTLEESDGYAVHSEGIERLLFLLSEMRRIEPKTARRDRWAKLDLQDPSEPGAESHLVRLYDSADAEIANLVVGKQNLYLQAIADGGVYIRKPGEDRAWLVSGDLTVGGEPQDWLEKRIIDIPVSRISQATVRHPNGEIFRIVRKGDSDDSFVLADLPPGKKLALALYPTDIARTLATLELEDARKRGTIAFDKETTVESFFNTADGLVVRSQLTELEDGDWMRLEVSVDDKLSSDAERRARKEEAAILNAHLETWDFRIPRFKSVHLKRRAGDILEDAGPGS